MTLKEAKAELQQAMNHVYNVEKVMDGKSLVRHTGYKVRLAIAEWENQLRAMTDNLPAEKIDNL